MQKVYHSPVNQSVVMGGHEENTDSVAKRCLFLITLISTVYGIIIISDNWPSSPTKLPGLAPKSSKEVKSGDGSLKSFLAQLDNWYETEINVDHHDHDVHLDHSHEDGDHDSLDHQKHSSESGHENSAEKKTSGAASQGVTSSEKAKAGPEVPVASPPLPTTASIPPPPTVASDKPSVPRPSVPPSPKSSEKKTAPKVDTSNNLSDEELYSMAFDESDDPDLNSLLEKYL